MILIEPFTLTLSPPKRGEGNIPRGAGWRGCQSSRRGNYRDFYRVFARGEFHAKAHGRKENCLTCIFWGATDNSNMSSRECLQTAVQHRLSLFVSPRIRCGVS